MTTRDNQQLTARIVCDNSCQTELTLPPILPKEVEDALRPYFTFMQNQQKTPSKDCDSSFNITMQNASLIDHDARNALLRRKLLYPMAVNVSDHSTDYERDVHLDSPAPQTPEMVSYNCICHCGHIKLIFTFRNFGLSSILFVVFALLFYTAIE